MNGNNITIGGLSGNGGFVTNSQAAAVTLTIAPTVTSSYSGAINNDGTVAVAIIGTGTQIFNGISNYSGGTTINSGTLGVAFLGDVGANSSIGVVSSISSLVLAGGGLQYLGAGNSTNILFTVVDGTATSFIDASGTGNLVFTNTGNIASYSNTAFTTWTLTGNNTGL